MKPRWKETEPGVHVRDLTLEVYLRVGPHSVMPTWHVITLFVRGEQIDLGQTWWTHAVMAKRVATERAKAFLGMAASAHEVLR